MNTSEVCIVYRVFKKEDQVCFERSEFKGRHVEVEDLSGTYCLKKNVIEKGEGPYSYSRSVTVGMEAGGEFEKRSKNLLGVFLLVIADVVVGKKKLAKYLNVLQVDNNEQLRRLDKEVEEFCEKQRKEEAWNRVGIVSLAESFPTRVARERLMNKN